MPNDEGSRQEFLDNVRRALGRSPGATPDPPPGETALSSDSVSLLARVDTVAREADERSEELLTELAESAARAGWVVARVGSPHEAGEYVVDLARSLEARSALRSNHPVFERLGLDEFFDGTGVDFGLMAIEAGGDESQREEQRRSLRDRAVAADLGVTGVDYAIAETGSCAIVAGQGVSRVVSLLPPVHIAIVEKGQVLPTLDDLFTIRRKDTLDGTAGGYMNIISGPSRSGDIEQQLVVGVHGPREVHMVLLG